MTTQSKLVRVYDGRGYTWVNPRHVEIIEEDMSGESIIIRFVSGAELDLPMGMAEFADHLRKEA